jgi:hypothetical protein
LRSPSRQPSSLYGFTDAPGLVFPVRYEDTGSRGVRNRARRALVDIYLY